MMMEMPTEKKMKNPRGEELFSVDGQFWTHSDIGESQSVNVVGQRVRLVRAWAQAKKTKRRGEVPLPLFSLQGDRLSDRD